jgi:hypothetical protein
LIFKAERHREGGAESLHLEPSSYWVMGVFHRLKFNNGTRIYLTPAKQLLANT